MTTITVQNKVIQKIHRLSNMRKLPVETLVEEALEEFWAKEQSRLMEVEEIAYQTMHSKLVATHLGKFVAILQGQLIDSDEDQEDLLERVHAAHPGEVILVTKVKHQPVEEYAIRSPRLEFE